MSPDRRRLILGATAIVVLGVALWWWWRPTPPPRSPAPAAQARARDGRAGVNSTSVGPADAVRLDALHASREDPGDAGRNPFRFQPKIAPSPPTQVAPVVTETPRLAPAGPTGPPPPPPIPLKLQGVLERANGVKWAVLSDGKSAPMYGTDGDIIDGKYLIVKIGTESIEMTHADGRGRQVIRLDGTK